MSRGTAHAGLRAHSSASLRFGITSVQTLSFGTAPSRLWTLARSADYAPRLRIVPSPLLDVATIESDVTAEDDRPRGGETGGVVSGMKLVLDGTPIERGALFRDAYADMSGFNGRANVSHETLRSILARGLARGTPLLFHAVGDSALTLLFSAMRELAPVSVPAA